MGHVPVYCIAGLGVNGLIFAKIRVDGHPLRHIEWLEPDRGESMQAYCGRMAEQIEHDEPIDLIALSFGGLIAIEMARQIPVRRIYLISSIKSRNEKPWFFGLMRYLPLYRLNIRFMRDRTTWLWGPFFGLKTKKDVALFYRFMPDLSDYYMRWAVRQICRWKNDEAPTEIIHIHGSRDKVFPSKKYDLHHRIDGATHSMVYTHGKLVSRIINRVREEARQRQGEDPESAYRDGNSAASGVDIEPLITDETQ